MLRAIIKADYNKHIKLFEHEIIEENSIVLLGDSLIKYWDTSKYYLNNNIINRGIPGDTTVGVLNRLDQIVKIAPSIIILNIGSNDIVMETENSVTEIVKRILKIKFHLESLINNVKVYVIGLTPVLRDHEITSISYMRERNNDIIEQINKELTIFTSIIDVNSYLKDETGNLKLSCTTDGLHLTNEGYYIFSKVIADNIHELVLREEKEDVK